VTVQKLIGDGAAMEAVGATFAKALRDRGYRIYLAGELGAGKTTWVRGFLRGLGYEGAVKSPTFALVEQYELDGRNIVHLDLYRTQNVEELEWIGIRDWLADDTICLVEWPERGVGALPEPDVLIRLSYQGEGREFSAEAHSPKGASLLAISESA